MIITKEHQEALVNKYAEKHTTDECIGFIDGLNTALELVKNLTIPSESLRCGRFNISKYIPYENDPINKETTIWIQNDDGEGTTINVEYLFERAM